MARRRPTDWLGILQRILILIGMLGGVVVAGIAIAMEQPPKSLPVWSLIALGILSVVAAAFGFIGTFFRNWLLIVYFVFGLIVLLLEIALLIGLFFFYDKALDTLTEGKPERMDFFIKYLDAGKWVLFALVIVQGISLFQALFTRIFCAEGLKFEAMDDSEERELQMKQLKDDIESRDTNKESKGLSARMKKYAAYTHSADGGLAAGKKGRK